MMAVTLTDCLRRDVVQVFKLEQEYGYLVARNETYESLPKFQSFRHLSLCIDVPGGRCCAVAMRETAAKGQHDLTTRKLLDLELL